MAVSIDETVDLVMATGSSKPLQMLGMGDVQEVIKLWLQYHLLVKVKAEMEQNNLEEECTVISTSTDITSEATPNEGS